MTRGGNQWWKRWDKVMEIDWKYIEIDALEIGVVINGNTFIIVYKYKWWDKFYMTLKILGSWTHVGRVLYNDPNIYLVRPRANNCGTQFWLRESAVKTTTLLECLQFYIIELAKLSKLLFLIFLWTIFRCKWNKFRTNLKNIYLFVKKNRINRYII